MIVQNPEPQATEKTNEKQSVGILAYGSLISDPRCEIENNCKCIVPNVSTPFPVEFARSSGLRGGAPTLVPFTDGDQLVNGQIFVMKLPKKCVVDILFRREIDKVGNKSYRYPATRGQKKNMINVLKATDKNCYISCWTTFPPVDVVLSAQFACNIHQPTGDLLACLAIRSITEAKPNRDGISYLIDSKECGIRTGLSKDYEDKVLEITGGCCLKEARKRAIERKTEIKNLENECLDQALGPAGEKVVKVKTEYLDIAKNKLKSIF